MVLKLGHEMPVASLDTHTGKVGLSVTQTIWRGYTNHWTGAVSMYAHIEIQATVVMRMLVRVGDATACLRMH